MLDSRQLGKDHGSTYSRSGTTAPSGLNEEAHLHFFFNINKDWIIQIHFPSPDNEDKSRQNKVDMKRHWNLLYLIY